MVILRHATSLATTHVKNKLSFSFDLHQHKNLCSVFILNCIAIFGSVLSLGRIKGPQIVHSLDVLFFNLACLMYLYLCSFATFVHVYGLY